MRTIRACANSKTTPYENRYNGKQEVPVNDLLSSGVESPRDLVRVLQKENTRLQQENADLRNQLIRVRQAIQALVDLEDTLSEINEETDVMLLIGRILMAALDAVDSENGSLLLVDEETDELVFVEVRGPYRLDLIGYRMPREQGIVGWSLTHRQPVLVPDARYDARFFQQVDEKLGFQTQTLICVPLFDDNRPLGAIEVVNSRSGRAFTQEDVNIMRLVALLATQALIRAERVLGETDEA